MVQAVGSPKGRCPRQKQALAIPLLRRDVGNLAKTPPCFRKKSRSRSKSQFQKEVCADPTGLSLKHPRTVLQALRRHHQTEADPAPKGTGVSTYQAACFHHTSSRYRLAGGAHSKQILLRQFAKNAIVSSKRDHVEAAAAPLVIKVERAVIEDGMRSFEIRVGDRQRLWASMWSGETYWMREEQRLFERKTWVPILNTEGPISAGSKELFPCGLNILPSDGECLCSAAPIDAKRSLPGLAHCIMRHRITHDGENALSAIFGVLTLGATGFRQGTERPNWA